MEQSLTRFRDFLTISKNPVGKLSPSQPQIGFKVSFCEKERQLKVKVIGARLLPTTFGNSSAKGYMVKVTVYPQKEKYETKYVKDSWPTINEEFIFTLNPVKKFDDYFKGKWVSLTVYAVLGDYDEEGPKKKKNTLKRFLSFNEYEDFLRPKSEKPSRRSYRNSLSDRRTVGAVTYNLERRIFTQTLRGDIISTPDIWRPVKEITSGVPTPSREGLKGSIELTLQYAVSEDGTNDMVEVSVTKFRCSLQTMQDHERIGGQLYIKIIAFESEDVLQKKKSDKFDPTISLKLELNTATLRARVNNYNLSEVKIVIRLMSKTIIGQKTLLGKIEIDRHSSLWKDIVSNPLQPITKMVHFV